MPIKSVKYDEFENKVPLNGDLEKNMPMRIYPSYILTDIFYSKRFIRITSQIDDYV